MVHMIDPKTSRLKVFLLPFHYALSMFARRTAPDVVLLPILDLPDDARVCSVCTDYMRQCFGITVESATFDEVPEGLQLPVQYVTEHTLALKVVIPEEARDGQID